MTMWLVVYIANRVITNPLNKSTFLLILNNAVIQFQNFQASSKLVEIIITSFQADFIVLSKVWNPSKEILLHTFLLVTGFLMCLEE